MEKETLSYNIPDGYEVDFEETKKQGKVIMKTCEKKYPTTWAGVLELISGMPGFYYNNYDDKVMAADIDGDEIGLGDFLDKETAEAFVALWKLLLYRRLWIGDWEPDWTDEKEIKYSIIQCRGNIEVDRYYGRSMAFPTEEMCYKFMKTFHILLEAAKPLL